MKNRLSFRFALTYGLIFILALAVIDTSLVFVYRDNQLKKNENFYIGIAGLLSEMVKNNVKITNYINTGEGLTGQNNGRVLLLDMSGKVLMDSGVELSGVHLTNPEYRKTIATGKPTTGYYSFKGKGMEMFSYPVAFSGHINAIILISVYIQDIYDDINRFTMQIIAISVLVGILVIAAAIWTGKRLSDPITRLTTAAEHIYNGKMDTTVEIIRNDEIGRLAGTFNKMSGELQKIETGRRRFISDVSHELKTPLASIKALLDACITGETDTLELNEYLRDIDHEIDILIGLVRSLLTSARLEEVMLIKEPLKLAEEIDYIIKVLMPIANEKQIDLQNACDTSIVINADRNMLREVLINLMENSIKYGIYGGFAKIKNSGNSFQVVDNGCGIPEEELQNIFDSFYRVDKSRTGESGSGIGLFIVKRIIELHGFKISVASKLGIGSEFTIYFE